MKTKFLIVLVIIFSFNLSVFSQTNTNKNTKENETTYVKSTEVAKIDRNVSNIKAIEELTKKKLGQESPYIITSFYYKNKVYWSAIEMKTMSEIFFYANKDLSKVKSIYKKDSGYGGTYESFVEEGILKK